MLCQEIMQPVRWPVFCHHRANAVEQSAWTASATGHHLRTIQMIVENVYVWLIGPQRLVSECWGHWLEILILTYLLTVNVSFSSLTPAVSPMGSGFVVQCKTTKTFVVLHSTFYQLHVRHSAYVAKQVSFLPWTLLYNVPSALFFPEFLH